MTYPWRVKELRLKLDILLSPRLVPIHKAVCQEKLSVILPPLLYLTHQKLKENWAKV